MSHVSDNRSLPSSNSDERNKPVLKRQKTLKLRFMSSVEFFRHSSGNIRFPNPLLTVLKF